jgi:hypothetical protein
MRRRIMMLILAAMLAISLVVSAAGVVFAAPRAETKQDCRDAERQGSTYTQPYKNYNNVYDNNGDCIQSVR